MDKVTMYASQPHYVDTLWPVAQALASRGCSVEWVSQRDAARARAHSFGAASYRGGRPNGGVVVVAGGMDARDVSGRDSFVVHLPHGAGQTYYGDVNHPVDSHGYAGGPELEGVGLFCVNREEEAARWRSRYPEAGVVVTGPPCLDTVWRAPMEPFVVFAFHWPCGLVAEAGSAWDDWREQVAQLVVDPDRGYRLGVAFHPRWEGRLKPWAAKVGVQVVDRLNVLDLATLVVADNTSLGYEAAAVGIPTVWLNASNWRKDVEHGLRFWSHVPGPQLEPGDDLGVYVRAAPFALQQFPWLEQARSVSDWVYGPRDGQASVRVADAIVDAVR